MILPPSHGDIWQCLQTFLVVLIGDGSVTGIQWIEARDSAEHSAVHRTPHTSDREADKPWSEETWEVFVERVGLELDLGGHVGLR